MTQMPKRMQMVAMAAPLLLASCGGGSDASSGGTSSGSTTPTPTPTSVPTPPSPGPPTLLTTAAGTALQGYGGVRNFVRDSNGVTAVAFSYSPAYLTPATIAGPGTFSYQIRAEFYGGTTPPAGTFALSRDATSDAAWSEYSATASGRVFRVSQLNVGPGNPLIALQYTTLAVASISYPNSAPGLTSYSVAPMAFGLPFDKQSMALHGTVTYDGQIAGVASAGQLEGIATPLGTKVIYTLSGTLRLVMNFDAATFSGEAHLIGKNDATGQTVDLGTYPTQGQIPPAGTSSSILGSLSGGNIQAILTGPAAEELEAAFEPMVPDPSNPSYFLKVMAVAAAKK